MTMTTMKTMNWASDGVLSISHGRWNEQMLPALKMSRSFQREALSSLSPDGTLCIGADEEDGVVRVRVVDRRTWSVGAPLFACQGGDTSPVLYYAWSQDGKVAVQQARGGFLCYQVAQGRPYLPGVPRSRFHLGTPLSGASPMVFSPDGKRVAIAGPTSVLLWEVARREETCPRTLPTISPVTALCWSPDDGHLAIGSRDGNIRLYLTRSGRLFNTWRSGYEVPVTALCWSPTGTCLLSGDEQGQVLLWETSASDKARAWKARPVRVSTAETKIEACAWSPTGERFALLDGRNNLVVYVKTSREN